MATKQSTSHNNDTGMATAENGKAVSAPVLSDLPAEELTCPPGNPAEKLISSPARGCLSTPQTGNLLARPGPPLGRIGTYEQRQARS